MTTKQYISRFVHVSFGYHCFPKLLFFPKMGRNANCRVKAQRTFARLVPVYFFDSYRSSQDFKDEGNELLGRICAN